MNPERMYQILLGAHISEKATTLADQSNQIAFKVAKDATAPEIKEAIEQIYEVEVLNVTVLNMKGKVKRRLQKFGKRPDWKKAYVRLAPDQDIQFG
ncbi:MAG: 50S ribosomal protein L23 [Pseudomonadales bacterium]